MTKVIYRHIENMRANFRYIGAAVSASSEFACAANKRSETVGSTTAGIPL